MFGFFSPIPLATPLLVTAATATATGAVTFNAMTAAGVGNVPVVATGSTTFGDMTTTGTSSVGGPLLRRDIPPRNLLMQRITRARR